MPRRPAKAADGAAPLDGRAPMMDATLARIAGFAADLPASDLPAPVLHECKRRLIDTLGCGLAGFDADASRFARGLALRMRDGQGATVLGTAHRTLPELAAFANGVMTRYLDGNDCCPGGGGHPSDAIPAILAMAEWADAGPAEALGAIVLAYELHHALFQAARIFSKGLDHPLYTAIAVAAATAKVLRLQRTQMGHAVALALTSNLALGATRRGELSMWKGCAGANAARNGVFAALAAGEGLTGPDAPFEGTHGLFELTGGFELGPLADTSGTFRILQTDMKSLVTEYHTQGPVGAALELRKGLDVGAIERIAIHTYSFAYKEIGSGREKWRPRTRETADHSLPYTVAAVLVDGAFSDAIFAPERFTDDRILALADRISVHDDPALSAQVPQAFPCRLEITTADGRIHAAGRQVPRGHHDDPMSDAEVAAKFRDLAGRKLAPASVERALDVLWNAERACRISDLLAPLQVA
jgi:2-methylcitrate dehydratase